MNPRPRSSTDRIYQRTHKGHVVCCARPNLMDAARLTLMRLVNGFTPLDVLLDLVSSHISEPMAVVHELEAAGFIEDITPVPQLALFRD